MKDRLETVLSKIPFIGNKLAAFVFRLKTHIKNLKRANDEGVPVIGYSCWSFMDNFEWAEGYCKRFGLVYVDYRTQKRIIKDSAYTFREIIETNGEK